MENSVVDWWIDNVGLKRKEVIEQEGKPLTDEEIAEVLKSLPYFEEVSDSFWYVKAAIALDKKRKDKNTQT
jgi:hypothetical protein